MEEEIYVPRRRRRRRRPPKWPFFVIAGLMLALLIVGVTALVIHNMNEYRVDLTMKGASEMTLEYGQIYSEPGAEAVGYGTHLKKEPQPLDVTIRGEVDATKLGSYTITYSAAFEDAVAEATRTVTVVDREAPVITLVSDPEHYTLPGQAYQEEGFSAVDNYDGDLTDRVQSREEDGKMIYTVTDSSGNETQITREIYYHDPDAPKLTLKGDSTITITAGDAWKEPGYTATDNVDGDITAQVKITGTVDNKTAGTYKLTYEVADSSGNKTTVQRTVVVKSPPQPEPPKEPDQGAQNNQGGQSNQGGSENQGGQSNIGEGKVIYLTFDDGPSVHTPRLLEVLAKYNVKATFFVCNTHYLEYLDDIAKAGHSLAVHSKTHDYETIYASEAAFFEDLYAMQEIIYQYSGVKTTLMRFPGGSSNSISKRICPGIMTKLTQAVQEKGFQYFDWNVDSNDAGGAKDAATVAQNVINGIKNSKRTNHFVLQHDIHGYSVDAVEQIVKWGLENGYTFLPLDSSSPECHHGVNN